MPGTVIPHGSICLCACYAMSGTDIAYGQLNNLLEQLKKDPGALSCYRPATLSLVLTSNMILPVQEALDRSAPQSAYVLATRCPVLSERLVLCRQRPATRCPVLTCAMCLHNCYAMSGTERAYGAMPTAACYEPPRTSTSLFLTTMSALSSPSLCNCP
eukprot:3556666-Rhodomonas_salina.1